MWSSAPTWYQLGLGLPGSNGVRRAAGLDDGNRHLRVGHEPCRRRIDAVGEGHHVGVLVEEREAVGGGLDRRRRGILRQEAEGRFPHVRDEGLDIDQADDLVVVAGFGDDRATIGMADEDHGSVLTGQHPVHRGNVVGERRERVLDDRDVESVLGENVIDRAPAGTVRPGAMHQHDVLHRVDGDCGDGGDSHGQGGGAGKKRERGRHGVLPLISTRTPRG
jgi:hypothetical protein